MGDYRGRGAWSQVGGALKLDRTLNKTVPGPYYMAPVNSDFMMGRKVAQQIANFETPDLNEYAVYMGIREIQERLNEVMGSALVVDGILGPKTDAAIKALQTKLGTTADGMIGPNTATKMFVPVIQKIATAKAVDWTVIAGITKQESSFDPGAVGYYDPEDLGLEQINGPSHKELTAAQRFDVPTAVGVACDKYKYAVSYFKGNIRDAIASYNLGLYGATLWIQAGRPDSWTPPGTTTPRDMKGYIDNILNAF